MIQKLIKKIPDNKFTVIIVIFTVCIVVSNILLKDQLLNGFRYILSLNVADVDSTLCFMSQNAGFFGSATWTLTSVVGAFAIYYYSTLGEKNCGIENRKIITYGVGFIFVPVLLCIIFFSTLCMTVAYYAEAYTCFFSMASYSVLLQIFMVFVCIISNSYKVGSWIIKRTERKLYSNIYKKPIAFYDEWAFHVSAIMTEDLTEDFIKLLKEIMKIPYEVTIEKISNKDDDKNLERAILYYYMFQNVRAIVGAVNERNYEAELNRMYKMLYEIVEEIWKYRSEKEEDQEYIMINKMEGLSAIFQALILYCDSGSKWDAIIFLINKKLTEEEDKRLAVGILLASISYLIITKRLNIEEEWERAVNNPDDKINGGELRNMVESFGLICLEKNWSVENDGNNLSEIIQAWGICTTDDTLKNSEIYVKILDILCHNKRMDTQLDYLIIGLTGKINTKEKIGETTCDDTAFSV